MYDVENRHLTVFGVSCCVWVFCRWVVFQQPTLSLKSRSRVSYIKYLHVVWTICCDVWCGNSMDTCTLSFNSVKSVHLDTALFQLNEIQSRHLLPTLQRRFFNDWWRFWRQLAKSKCFQTRVNDCRIKFGSFTCLNSNIWKPIVNFKCLLSRSVSIVVTLSVGLVLSVEVMQRFSSSASPCL